MTMNMLDKYWQERREHQEFLRHIGPGEEAAIRYRKSQEKDKPVELSDIEKKFRRVLGLNPEPTIMELLTPDFAFSVHNGEMTPEQALKLQRAGAAMEYYQKFINSAKAREE